MVLKTVHTHHHKLGLYNIIDTAFVRYPVMLPYRKQDIFSDTETVKQRPALKKKTVIRAYPAQLIFRQIVNPLIVEIHLAGRRPQQNYKVFYQNGLPAPARPDYHRRLASLYIQGDVVQNGVVIEFPGNIFKNKYIVGTFALCFIVL
jgi:hypothetical protein